MRPLRRLALNNRALTSAVIALALAMKLLMPGGFMPGTSHGRIVINICSGAGPATIVMPVTGPENGQTGGKLHGKAEPLCAFAGLSVPSIGAADPLLLGLAILFVMALALRPMVRRVAALPRYLRPHLRGPPSRR